jgi:hypothetical protein
MPDVVWLKEIIKKRNEATLGADGEEESFLTSSQKLTRHFSRKRKPLFVEAGIINIDLPAFTFDGKEIDAITLRVRTSDESAKAVSIEVCVEALDYVRYACLASLQGGANRRIRPAIQGEPNVVRWLTKRNGFIATDVAKKTKFFPTIGKEVDDVRNDAIAWAKAWDRNIDDKEEDSLNDDTLPAEVVAMPLEEGVCNDADSTA